MLIAKANSRFVGTSNRTHAVSDEYKIPIKDRKAYMNTNTAKWVTKKEYRKYLDWVKKGRPKRE